MIEQRSRPAALRSAPGLDALFSDLEARGLFSGAVVVGRGRSIVWEKGFGYVNVARGVAFTPDTPADGGSLAKTFTAALLMTLQHDDKLDLDAPAVRLLPELPYPEITLSHLLTHSSGLPVHDYFYVPGLDFMIGFKKDPDSHPGSMNVSSKFEEQWGRRVDH